MLKGLRKLSSRARSDQTRLLFWAGIAGVIGSLAAMAYEWAGRLFFLLFYGIASRRPSLLEAAAELPWTSRLLFPLLGALLTGLLLYRFRRQLSRGPGEILEAVAITDGRIPARPSLLKTLASLLTLSTGGSIGREGAVIQLSAMASSQLGQWTGLSPAQLRILVGCGTAAGIAAAFHTPIGAALFVMEIIFGNFAIEFFGPLVFASVLSTVTYQAILGKDPLYYASAFHLKSLWEIPLYAILGILAGIVAPLALKLLWRMEGEFHKRIGHVAVRLAIAGLAAGVVGIAFPQVWGNGAETIAHILKGYVPWKLLLLFLLLKPFLTFLYVGAGAPGGVFTPTLFLGACLGGIFGEGVNAIWSVKVATPVSYALIGMGCTLAGTAHAPLTAIFMLFEMSLNYDAVLPLMLSCGLASLISRQFNADSIYTEPLRRQGVRATKIPEAHLMTTLTVSEAMQPVEDGDLLPPQAPFLQVTEHFLARPHTHVYVADEAQEFMGAISLHDIKSSLKEGEGLKFLIAQDLMRSDFLCVTPREKLADALEKFLAQDCERLPVVDNYSTRKLVGTLSKRNLLDIYNRQVMERGSLLTSTVSTLLADTSQIVRIPVANGLAGKSLASLDLRRAFGVNVVLVERPLNGKVTQVPPRAEDPLVQGDTLLVMGSLPELDRFRAFCAEES